MTDRTRRYLAKALAGFALTSTAAGLLALVAFDDAPGDRRGAPSLWPRGSELARPGRRAELLVFVHPFCGCTTATLAELARLAASLPDATRMPAVTLAVFRPALDPAWTFTSVQTAASAVPGARLVWDDRGREARRFGARTSGDVLLYSSSGELLFHGGVTGARGHEGDNYGLSQLSQVLTRPASLSVRSGVREAPVFGCALGALPAEEDTRAAGQAASSYLPIWGVWDKLRRMVENIKSRLPRPHDS